MAENLPATVIDNGSGTIKAGLANEVAPRCVFSTIVGRPKGDDSSKQIDGVKKSLFIGDEAQLNRDICDLQYPIKNGRIVRWDDMEAVWEHLFYKKLGIASNSDQRKCMLTEPVFSPIKNKEKTAEIMFEKFNLPGLYIAIQPVLALYASGRTTGLVLDSGDGVTQFVPVYEGQVIPAGAKRIDLAGRKLTAHMQELMQKREENGVKVDQETARTIKEKTAYVALDFEKGKAIFEKDPSKYQTNYTLPDGKVINVGTERFHAPECLFNPKMLGLDLPGIHEAVDASINDCELDTRLELMRNIILSGGSTMLPGFAERLIKEVNELYAVSHSEAVEDISYEAPSERQFSVWCGGAVLASQKTFNDWMSKEDYEEEGPYAARRMSGGVSSY